MPFLLASADASTQAVVLDLLVILAAAGLVAVLLGRLRLSTIPGFLITGALIGPHALQLVSEEAHIKAISGLAIILLMFTVGLHLDLGAIRSRLVNMLALGIGSTLGSAVLITLVAMAFGLSVPTAVAIGMAMSISSTAVVLRLLQQEREMRTPVGRICVSLMVTQDLLSIVFLAVLPLIAQWGGVTAPGDEVGNVAHAVGGTVAGVAGGAGGPGGAAGGAGGTHGGASDLLVHALVAVAGIAVLVGFGKVLLPRLLNEAARVGGSEVLLVLAAGAALGAAVLTSVLGFSPELGAFLAGFLLASTPFRHQLAGQLSPIRDLLMAVFFTVVGLGLNGSAVLDSWWVVGLALVALLGVKVLSNSFAAWATGAAATVALPLGVIVAQGGEFSLVILGVAGDELGLIGKHVQPLLIALVFLSLLLTPIMYHSSHKLKPRATRFRSPPWIKRPDLGEEVPAHAPPAQGEGAESEHGGESAGTAENAGTNGGRGHVIIAGFGVVGRAVADRLEDAGTRCAIVDMNVQTVRSQRRLKRSAHYGDITNPEVLESAGIHHADAVVLTIPDDEATIRACQVIRSINPGVFIAARTNFLSKGMMATSLGADHVVVEEVAAAEMMSREVMERLGERKQGSRQ